jgi:hypothetical protein
VFSTLRGKKKRRGRTLSVREEHHC